MYYMYVNVLCLEIFGQNPVYGPFEIIPHVSLFSHALCMHYVIFIESAVDSHSCWSTMYAIWKVDKIMIGMK